MEIYVQINGFQALIFGGGACRNLLYVCSLLCILFHASWSHGETVGGSVLLILAF